MAECRHGTACLRGLAFVASSGDGMACLLSLCPSLQTCHVFGYKRSIIASL